MIPDNRLSQKVLFVAHHYPPMGGPGTNRSLRLTQYLRKYGYEPIVLTIDLEDIRASRYPIDWSLMEDVPDIEIVRTPTKEPRRLIRMLTKMRIYRVLWFGMYAIFWEKDALWPFAAFSTAKDIVRRHGIRLVYTTSGPYSALLLGYMLQKTNGVRWVADLRDPYSDGFWWQWPSKAHWILSRMVERFLLRSADKVVVNTPSVAHLYAKNGFVKPSRLAFITNGY